MAMGYLISSTIARPIVNFDQSDSDEDGLGNACDPDDDNDGVDDENDAFPFDDSESIDTDLDGTGNSHRQR